MGRERTRERENEQCLREATETIHGLRHCTQFRAIESLGCHTGQPPCFPDGEAPPRHCLMSPGQEQWQHFCHSTKLPCVLDTKLARLFSQGMLLMQKVLYASYSPRWEEARASGAEGLQADPPPRQCGAGSSKSSRRVAATRDRPALL